MDDAVADRSPRQRRAVRNRGSDNWLIGSFLAFGAGHVVYEPLGTTLVGLEVHLQSVAFDAAGAATCANRHVFATT